MKTSKNRLTTLDIGSHSNASAQACAVAHRLQRLVRRGMDCEPRPTTTGSHTRYPLTPFPGTPGNEATTTAPGANVPRLV